MRFCRNCGAQCDDNTKFCGHCGTPMEQQNNQQMNYNYTQQTDYNQNSYVNNAVQNVTYQDNPGPMITPRSIPLAIILTIVTCGIYAIYWMIKLNDEVNSLSNQVNAASGVVVFILTIVTCGIYGIYWNYKMGERCDRIKGVQGSSAILYLVLSLFGLGIVSYCLMQDTINKAL